jgi:hypothetical protein
MIGVCASLALPSRQRASQIDLHLCVQGQRSLVMHLTDSTHLGPAYALRIARRTREYRLKHPHGRLRRLEAPCLCTPPPLLDSRRGPAFRLLLCASLALRQEGLVGGSVHVEGIHVTSSIEGCPHVKHIRIC